MKKVGQIYREALINNIKESIDKNENAFLLAYSNVSGPQFNDLRKNLRKAGARLFVSKSSMARVALKDLNYSVLVDDVSSQIAFVCSNSDSVEVAKVLINFVKGREKVIVKGGLLSGRVLGQDEVKKLSELPAKEVLLAMLLGTIQAPLTRLAGALNGKTRDLLSVLKQLSDKKGGK